MVGDPTSLDDIPPYGETGFSQEDIFVPDADIVVERHFGVEVMVFVHDGEQCMTLAPGRLARKSGVLVRCIRADAVQPADDVERSVLDHLRHRADALDPATQQALDAFKI